MRETDSGIPPDSVAGPEAGFRQATAALRRLGAAQFDPVGLHYLEQLATRALTQPAPVQRILAARLEQGLAALQARLEQARGEANATLSRLASEQPQASKALQPLFDAGDFKALQRLAARPQAGGAATSLGELTRSMGQSAADPADASWSGAGGTRVELKSVRNFRNTWSKLSADQQLARAMGQAPKNAGPINSHAVVLRSLALMRDISPDYLNRFMSYVDTLLCLDQEASAAGKAAADGETGKKPRARRAAPR